MAESSDSKEARLRKVSLFSKASSQAISHLASASDEVTVEAGHVLIEKGRFHSEVFLIEAGTATVEIDGAEIDEITEGEFVGELGFFLQGRPATATVRAKTDVELLVIPYNRFDQILEENPSLLRAITCELAIRLQQTDARLS